MAPHHEERGYNAIYLTNVVNCWVARVRLMNADSAVVLNNVDFTTVDAVYTGTTAGRATAASPYDGHNGLSVNYGNDILFRDFHLHMVQTHDLAVHATAHVVFDQGWGRDLTFDCHRTAPWGTLWSNIRVGYGRRLYSTGGGASMGFPCASRTTFYNLSRDVGVQTIRLPPSGSAGVCTWSTRSNFIGNFASGTHCPQYWVYGATDADYRRLRLPQTR